MIKNHVLGFLIQFTIFSALIIDYPIVIHRYQFKVVFYLLVFVTLIDNIIKCIKFVMSFTSRFITIVLSHLSNIFTYFYIKLLNLVNKP